MGDEVDPVARARAIAAQLSGLPGGAGAGDGSRKRSRWGDEPAGPPQKLSTADALEQAMVLGLTQTREKKKIYFPSGPEFADIDFRKLLIGPKGMTQKDMEDRTGAKILIRGRGSTKDGGMYGGDDDDDEIHVLIEGYPNGIEQATAEIELIMSSREEALRLKQEQLRMLSSGGPSGGGPGGHYGPGDGGGGGGMGFGGRSDEVNTTVDVPNALVGSLIGRGGENIQSIQRLTGCHVQITRESEVPPGSNMRPVHLRGSADAVERAKAEINRTIEDKRGSMGSHYGPNDLSNPNVQLQVPNDKVGLVIGKGGMTIKSIQERTGANIQIPGQPDDNNPNVRTITISAPTQDACDTAAKEVNSIVADKQDYGYGSSDPPTHLPIPNAHAGLLIGKGGSTIRSLQERTGTRVQIPSQPDAGTNPPTRTITITGPPECQQQAIAEINQLLANVESGGGGSYGSNSWDSSYYQTYDPYSYYYNQQAYAQHGVTPAEGSSTDSSAKPADQAYDPAAYYEQFWQYAAYYGEALARQYYGEWSPPVGTAPPAGVVIPPDNAGQEAAAKAADPNASAAPPSSS